MLRLDSYPPSCTDYSSQCPDWASSGQCESSEWVMKNCKLSCRKCFGSLPKQYDIHYVPFDLKPIAFLLGRWRSEFGGKARFPTIPNFTYGEQLDFKLSDTPLFGMPSMNYSAFAWGINNKESLHSEYGFLTVKNHTNTIGLTTVMNNGFTTVEEGQVSGNRIVLKLVDIGRISWSRDLPVLDMIREITLIDPTTLEQRLQMETLTHKMQDHTFIRFPVLFKLLLYSGNVKPCSIYVKKSSVSSSSTFCSASTIALALCLAVFFADPGWNVYISLFVNKSHKSNETHDALRSSETSARKLYREACKITCSIEIVESIPDNLTFDSAILPKSTFAAWNMLLALAENEINIAAYKTSLRGKHILNKPDLSTEMGEKIFDQLLKAGTERHVRVRMVENYPPKDRGDNADGLSLASKGALHRRSLHLKKYYGSGTMHSKFFVVDDRHFYLGSANLDWRSLNQKMELGVLVLNCPCLAKDLKHIFASYWNLASQPHLSLNNKSMCFSKRDDMLISETDINHKTPLTVQYKGVDTDVYIAASPTSLNTVGRTWDLEAIVSAISSAKRFIYIHVMDFIPMVLYKKPRNYWPVIDTALRKAVIESGVELKILVAALHFVKENLAFLKSLQAINGCSTKGSVEIKIFNVPAITAFQRQIARDRRTHNKFMVTENTVIIGTSNWSGDYFTTTTGLALVSHQNGLNRPFVDSIREIFLRDWKCSYAHALSTYIQHCLENNNNSNMCENSKT
ncbi:Phospholipase D3 [Trichinella pseudospiralis]|uniref:Phospholipase D3 n=1 Tax=Trichinella pseudospiralis TaxID=6337 RepID=A0A0V1E8X7_TRIPS|nr:Phospholipase D3 [Trichinella pseudospiralis]